MPAVPTLADVRAAARTLAEQPLHRTPTWRSRALGERIGAEAYLKLELFQKTGSFKPRGAFVRLLALTAEERGRGVIAVSAGNHAQGLAYAAARLGVAATIVTWQTAPEVKLVAARAYGGETLRLGETPLEAFEAMRRLQVERGLVLVHPYDDLLVASGQGTVGLELAEDVAELRTVVVGIGGGGLIAGCAAAVRGLHPQARVIGVEPEGAPTLTSALAAGEPVPLPHIDTIADGLSAPIAAELTLAAVRALVDEVVLVSDDELRDAMRFLAERAKIVAEPAGAAAVAALLSGRVEMGEGRVAAIVSGGNVDPALFASAMTSSGS